MGVSGFFDKIKEVMTDKEDLILPNRDGSLNPYFHSVKVSSSDNIIKTPNVVGMCFNVIE